MLLIVENDLGFARFLLDAAREKGFKGLVTSLGAAALALTREYKPDAITLDIYLPDIDGWRVLERLKNDLATRHIPVCVISTDDARERALASGRLAFVAKPIQSRDVLDELLDDAARLPRPAGQEPAGGRAGRRPGASRSSTGSAGEDVQVTAVADGAAAAADARASGRSTAWCSARRAGDAGRRRWPTSRPQPTASVSRLPVIVYGDGDDRRRRRRRWKRLADVCTVRRVHSPDGCST